MLQSEEQPLRIAVAGLGTGTLAAYGRPGWDLTFYEIDPAVAKIASNPAFFTYLSKSLSPLAIVPGDARLMLARAPAADFDLIVLDAFSSDAIPVHLLTKEAISLYFEKLRPRGLLALHLTNLNLDLVPIIARIAAELGVKGFERQDYQITERERIEKPLKALMDERACFSLTEG